MIQSTALGQLFFAEESLTASRNNAENGNLNLGMYQLIARERGRLGIAFVCDHEIWQSEDTVLPGHEGYKSFILARGYALIVDDGNSVKMVSRTTRKRYSTKEKREDVCECGHEIIPTMKLSALSIGTTAAYGKTNPSDLTDLPSRNRFVLAEFHSAVDFLEYGF